MTWIPIHRSSHSFDRSPAIKLYRAESSIIALSLTAWEQMGKPSHLAVLFDPALRLIGFRPGTDGYKLHLMDTHKQGKPAAITVGCARAIRQLCTQHSLAWPNTTTITPLSQDADDASLWVAQLPTLAV